MFCFGWGLYWTETEKFVCNNQQRLKFKCWQFLAESSIVHVLQWFELEAKHCRIIKNSPYSGSCRSSGNNYHSCIAKRSQKKSVNVILNHLNGNEPECRTVEIDEHLECQCGCGKTQSDCKSIQVWFQLLKINFNLSCAWVLWLPASHTEPGFRISIS